MSAEERLVMNIDSIDRIETGDTGSHQYYVIPLTPKAPHMVAKENGVAGHVVIQISENGVQVDVFDAKDYPFDCACPLRQADAEWGDFHAYKEEAS